MRGEEDGEVDVEGGGGGFGDVVPRGGIGVDPPDPIGGRGGGGGSNPSPIQMGSRGVGEETWVSAGGMSGSRG